MARRRRVKWGITLTIILLCVSFARLVMLQVVKAPELSQAALDSRMRTYEITAPRGQILDAEGHVLAASAQVVHVGVNQVKIRNYVHTEEVTDEEGKKATKIVGVGPAEAARQIGEILDLDPIELGGKMVGDRSYRVIAKNLTPAAWREIKALGIDGIEPDFVSVRTYPNGSTAGNIIGYVDRDGVPRTGLELSFDEELTGVPGEERVEVGGGGPKIPTGVSEKIDAQPGSTVRLNLLRDLQDVAQDSVQKAKDTYGAAWAAAVVQEVGTGKILAIADSDSIDPNEYWKSSGKSLWSRAISAVYEPGSTGKLLTYATAIDQGTVTPTTEIVDTSTYTTPNGQVINDFAPHPTERRTVAGVLMKSYNTGTVKIGETVSDEVRYDYFKKFGLGELADIGMPGQAKGLLVPPEKWDGRQKYTTMFGQGYALTLLQNVGIVQTIANGGEYVAPQLVKGLEDADGVFHASEETERRQVLTPETAEQMLLMMEGVTQPGGTGVRAAIDGYRVAAKTGTAQVAGPTGALTQTAGVFNAVIPADNPRLAISVVVYAPTSGFQGGIVAAPVFKEIATFAVRYLGIPPSDTEPDLYPVEIKENS
ncbi:MAG: penicillin-binding protein 2 [Bowdeniella nasicola]|nr:penicillin-binding protein 2 [Bowdeniella nasicola]